MPAIRGARPIRNKEILDFHNNCKPAEVTLEQYSNVWREWLIFSNTKSIIGLDTFKYADYTQGTSQTFDNFILKHAVNKEIICLTGDFQYHACLGKHVQFKYVKNYNDFVENIVGKNLHAVIISFPFSDYGCMHPEFYDILNLCILHDFPVCIDLAYWGIAKNLELDLNYKCIKEVTCSLSKPFFTLENHRVGIRFTKDYADDGISMLNEVNMQNNYSMALGVEYMRAFSPDYNWQKYKDQYEQVCNDNDLVYTDTVIFGLGDKTRHAEFNRGIPNNYRVCVSGWLNDV